MSTPETDRGRHYLATFLIFIVVIAGTAVGWSVGQHFAEAKLNGVDGFGEALIVSLFYDTGVYDLLPIAFAAIGAAIATKLIAFPLALVRFRKIYRQIRNASEHSRDELLTVQRHDPMDLK